MSIIVSIVDYLLLKRIHMINNGNEWEWMDPQQQKSEGWFRRPTKKDVRYRQGRSKRQVEDSQIIVGWTLTIIMVLIVVVLLKLIFDFLGSTAT